MFIDDNERASVASSFIPVGYELRFIDDHEKASVKDFFMPGSNIHPSGNRETRSPKPVTFVEDTSKNINDVRNIIYSHKF